MPHRILTPTGHSEETLAIAHDLIPDGYELVSAPHGRPEFWELLKDAPFYIGAGQFKHGPEFYAQAPKLKLVQTLSAGYNTYDLDAARAGRAAIRHNRGPHASARRARAYTPVGAVAGQPMRVHERRLHARSRGNVFRRPELRA